MEEEIRNQAIPPEETPGSEESGTEAKGKVHWFTWVLVIFLVLGVGGWVFLFYVNRFSLVVVPRGEASIHLEYGSPYAACSPPCYVFREAALIW